MGEAGGHLELPLVLGHEGACEGVERGWEGGGNGVRNGVQMNGCGEDGQRRRSKGLEGYEVGGLEFRAGAVSYP